MLGKVDMGYLSTHELQKSHLSDTMIEESTCIVFVVHHSNEHTALKQHLQWRKRKSRLQRQIRTSPRRAIERQATLHTNNVE